MENTAEERGKGGDRDRGTEGKLEPQGGKANITPGRQRQEGQRYKGVIDTQGEETETEGGTETCDRDREGAEDRDQGPETDDRLGQTGQAQGGRLRWSPQTTGGWWSPLRETAERDSRESGSRC